MRFLPGAISSDHMKLLLALALGCIPCATLGCTQKAKSANQQSRVPRMERFIFPAGYKGPFVAVYGQSDATEPTWNGDTAIFTVPPSGVVRIPYPEPPRSSRTSHFLANEPTRALDNYQTCEDMRVHVTDALPRVCWFGHTILGTGIPSHIVAVVTDWSGIPANFNRTSFVYDSVLFQGKNHMYLKWEEPPEILKRRQEQRRL